MMSYEALKRNIEEMERYMDRIVRDLNPILECWAPTQKGVGQLPSRSQRSKLCRRLDHLTPQLALLKKLVTLRKAPSLVKDNSNTNNTNHHNKKSRRKEFDSSLDLQLWYEAIGKSVTEIKNISSSKCCLYHHHHESKSCKNNINNLQHNNSLSLSDQVSADLDCLFDNIPFSEPSFNSKSLFSTLPSEVKAKSALKVFPHIKSLSEIQASFDIIPNNNNNKSSSKAKSRVTPKFIYCSETKQPKLAPSSVTSEVINPNKIKSETKSYFDPIDPEFISSSSSKVDLELEKPKKSIPKAIGLHQTNSSLVIDSNSTIIPSSQANSSEDKFKVVYSPQMTLRRPMVDLNKYLLRLKSAKTQKPQNHPNHHSMSAWKVYSTQGSNTTMEQPKSRHELISKGAKITKREKHSEKHHHHHHFKKPKIPFAFLEAHGDENRTTNTT